MAEQTRPEQPGARPSRPTKPVKGRAAERAKARARRRGPTPKGGRAAAAAPAGGRYTAPIPSSSRHSPKWYPWMLLTLLGLGVLVIILNYVQALPASPTNWYTVGGIVALLAGAFLATGWR